MAEPLALSDRLVIRPWSKRDRSAVEYWSRPEVPEHWFDAGASVGRRVSYAVDLDSNLIGRITLRDVTVTDARLGIYLKPDAIGLGYGWRSLDLFCGVAFRCLDLERLLLDTAHDNVRAVSAFRRAGFTEIGTFERNGFHYLEMERRHDTPARIARQLIVIQRGA